MVGGATSAVGGGTVGGTMGVSVPCSSLWLACAALLEVIMCLLGYVNTMDSDEVQAVLTMTYESCRKP